MRAFEDTPTYTTARQVPQINPLGSVHIPIVDPYEGITYEQIMETVIPCDIMLGGLGSDVATSIKKMDQARASP